MGFHSFWLFGIVSFFSPDWIEGFGKDETFARSLGVIIVFVSFVLANFALYGKTVLRVQTLNKDLLVMYPYKLLAYNAVDSCSNIGPEPIKDLEVWLTYKGSDGKLKREHVIEFFPLSSENMIEKQFIAHFLREEQGIRFRLPRRKSTMDGKVKVQAEFVGAKTGKRVKTEQHFDLE